MKVAEVVEVHATALSKGDIIAAFSFFSEDAKWHQPGNNQFSGSKSGLDSIGQTLSEMMRATNRSLLNKPAAAMMVNGNLVACPVRFSAQIGDKSIEMDGIDLYEVVDGEIVQVWLFSGDQPAEDAFWN